MDTMPWDPVGTIWEGRNLTFRVSAQIQKRGGVQPFSMALGSVSVRKRPLFNRNDRTVL